MDTRALAELRERDRSYHLHPFTHHPDMQAAGGTHVIERGEGCYLIDATGRKLFDALAGLWCVNVGYGRSEIIDAVTRQMRQLAYYPSFFNSTTEPAVELAARLGRLAPPPAPGRPPRLRRTIFSNSGSEANESALKLIRAYWKLKSPRKTKILTRTFAYHGVTIATTSMTGLPSCYAPFDLPLPGAGFIHVPGPHPYGVNSPLDAAAYGQWCLDETQRTIEREGADTIAALFAEPVQGAGGVIVPPEGYLQQLRELCRANDILFVADEVITGFGRLGSWFASTLWRLDPDILVMAKGLTSGYLPLGATMISTSIGDVLDAGGYVAHGFTYTGHPTTCAAALANLDIIEKEKLVEKVRDDTGPYFQSKLAGFRGRKQVGEVRGFGLIGAIDLLPQGGKQALDPAKPLGAKAAAIARQEGVIVRGIRDLIAVSPPLIATRTEIDQLFEAVERTLAKLWD